MDKLLSVIVPSYNAEKFLEHTLSYLVNCSHLQRLDIIVVDDGSTDKTAEIATDFENEFPDDIRVITQANGGYGSAINTGIKSATGRYFKVVDADDWLDSRNLDTFVELLKRENTDLILTPFWAFNDVNKSKRLQYIKPETLNWKQRYYLKTQVIDRLPSMHTYTLRTELLQENEIHLDTHIYYVDIEYILYPIPFVKTFKFVNLPLYNYRVNQPNQSISLNNMRKHQQQHDLVVEHVNDYIKEHLDGMNDNQFQLMVGRLSRLIATQMKIMTLSPLTSGTRKNLDSFYRKVKEEYYFNLKDINLPIRWLIGSNFYLFPIIRCLAILKMDLVHF